MRSWACSALTNYKLRGPTAVVVSALIKRPQGCYLAAGGGAGGWAVEFRVGNNRVDALYDDLPLASWRRPCHYRHVMALLFLLLPLTNGGEKLLQGTT